MYNRHDWLTVGPLAPKEVQVLQRAVGTKRRVVVLPPGQRKKVQPGNPKPTVGFRAHQGLVDYIETEKRRTGLGPAEILSALCDAAMDAERVLGLDWYEVVKMAAIEGVTPGTMLGQLALRSLKTKKR